MSAHSIISTIEIDLRQRWRRQRRRVLYLFMVVEKVSVVMSNKDFVEMIIKFLTRDIDSLAES